MAKKKTVREEPEVATAATPEETEFEKRLSALDQAERAIDRAYATGRADRAAITHSAQLDAAEAVAMAGIAMEADDAADEARRIRVIAEQGGDRDRIKKARAREREARKQAKADHRAATKSARNAYDAIRFSAPNTLGFMRAVQINFALHIAFTFVYLMLTSRDVISYDVSTILDWVMAILEGIAFWMFMNRYKIARPFVICMAAIGLVVPVIYDLSTGRFNPFVMIINGAVYLFLILYFTFSKRVKATLVNDFADRDAFVEDEFHIKRWSWPFIRNCIMYFIVFAVAGHWMEMGLCQFIIMGIAEGEYNPADTVLWRDWLYPFPMEGMAVVFIAIFFYPLFKWMLKKFKWRGTAYIMSFLSSALLCTAIEFTMGMIMNRDLQMWDYTNNLGNFMGQVCLQNTIAFGAAASIITWFVYPALEKAIARVPPDIMNIIFVVVLIFGGILWSLYIIDLPGIINTVQGVVT